jgi:3-hydroxyisobutyrate dehydrogenase-like beta-hydroxyacid dehydrogenase
MSDVNNANKAVIGLLHPGEMGAAVGRCLTARGHEVLWASRGRGPDTAARAAAAGLADAGTVTALAARAQVIISVCPPHAALDVAWAVHGFGGLYVDANAISPGTAREVARLICESGGRYVDGGIVGPPPDQPGRSRLYLSGGSPSGTGSAGTDAASAGTDAASSGTDAAQVAALFEGTPLDTRIVGGTATAASAVKMAYAAWTKGTAALLLSVRALAREQGVEARSAGAARSAAAKGWRWVGEMEEIAATMSAAGLPDGFHQAAAEIFRRSPRGAAGNDLLDQVLGELTGDSSAM